MGGENVLRGTSFSAANAKKTHCTRGHPFDDLNTYIETRSTRIGRNCRACHNAQSIRRRASLTARRAKDPQYAEVVRADWRQKFAARALTPKKKGRKK